MCCGNGSCRATSGSAPIHTAALDQDGAPLAGLLAHPQTQANHQHDERKQSGSEHRALEREQETNCIRLIGAMRNGVP